MMDNRDQRRTATGLRDDEMDVADRSLRRRFATMRPVRNTAVTPFGVLVARGRARADTQRRRRAHVVFALALALPIVILVTGHVRGRARVRDDVALARDVGGLVAWRSPTSTLLAPDYMQNVPALEESTIVVPALTPGGPQ